MDANIFYQKTTMDWLFLLRIENQGMFQLYATEDILAEVVSNMRKKKPTMAGRVTSRRVNLIRENLDEVLRDYPGDMGFTGGDPGDYHVHAAAVGGRADFLLTHNNACDFTAEPEVGTYSVIAPDEFFMLVSGSNPACLMPIVEKQLYYYRDHPKFIQLDDALMKVGCPAFALRVREELQRLALS